MDTNVLQTLRYKLQKRLKRINAADHKIYHSIVVQTFRFLTENAVVRGILDELERRVPSAEKDSEQLFAGRLLVSDNELERIGLAYALLKRMVASAEHKESHLGCRFGSSSKLAEGVQVFTDMFIEPLFDYIDEQIDDRHTVLGLLLKYKHHVEWFRRDDLRAKFEANTQKGETLLACDLYAYLHDQGLDFSIEPSSISGEADLISAQEGPERLVADGQNLRSRQKQGNIVPVLRLQPGLSIHEGLQRLVRLSGRLQDVPRGPVRQRTRSGCRHPFLYTQQQDHLRAGHRHLRLPGTSIQARSSEVV